MLAGGKMENDFLYENYDLLEREMSKSFPEVKLAGVRDGQYILRSENVLKLQEAKKWVLNTFLVGRLREEGYIE